MTNEEIIGFSEALDYFNLLSKEEQEKVPKEFITDMKKNAKKEYMGKIKTIDDIKKENISKDGAKKIAFIALFE